MSTDLEHTPEILEATAPDGITTTNLDVTDTPGTLLKLQNPTASFNNLEVQEQLDKILRFLVVFPDFLGSFFGEYRKPMTTVGLILLAGLGIAVADGVLDRLNAIPLFAPTFELIGLGFTGWVVARYLLYAETRQELIQLYEQVKGRILGEDG